MFRNIIKGRLFDHPIHVMLVHFPIACFPAALLFDILGMLLQDSTLFLASFYVILLGLALGVPASFFGFLDYVKLGDRPQAFTKATWHGGMQFLVLVIFGMIAGIKYQIYPNMDTPETWQFIAMGCGVALMLAGNYFGGELVFTHKVGVDESND